MRAARHWHILGAGAIGSLWACHAYKNGRPAKLILRDRQRLAQYREATGLMAQLAVAAELLPVTASCPEDLPTGIEHLLVTTKANQTLTALESVADKLAEQPLLVLLQNGLGVAQQIQQRFPQALILQASTTEGAYREGLFSLVHAGRGATHLGQSQDLAGEPLAPAHVAEIAQSLSFAPLRVQPCDNIDAVLWRKLAVNCVINPLTVIHRCRNGELLDNPLALAQMNSLIDEILLLSQHLGREGWVTGLAEQVYQVARDTALNRSSMLQDVEAGRETEIAYITGHLCQLGRQHGVDLPGHEKVLAALG